MGVWKLPVARPEMPWPFAGMALISNHDSSGGIQKPHALRTRTLTRLDSPNVSRSTVYERHLARRSAALPGVGSEGRSKLGIVETSTGVGVDANFDDVRLNRFGRSRSHFGSRGSLNRDGRQCGWQRLGCGDGRLPTAAAEAKDQEKGQPPHVRSIVALALPRRRRHALRTMPESAA